MKIALSSIEFPDRNLVPLPNPQQIATDPAGIFTVTTLADSSSYGLFPYKIRCTEDPVENALYMPKIIDCFSPRLNPRCPKLFFSVVIFATASVAIPDELDMAWQVGRYSFVIPAPTLGQADLLSAATPIDFSESVTTVGDAIRLALKNSGYRLADIKKMPLDTRTMLSLPLPQIHRHFDALPLWQVLHTLVGAQFVLINDPVHRLIGFEPCRQADQKRN